MFDSTPCTRAPVRKDFVYDVVVQIEEHLRVFVRQELREPARLAHELTVRDQSAQTGPA